MESLDDERRVAELRTQVILYLFTVTLWKSEKMKYRRLDYTESPKRVRLSRQVRGYYRKLAGPDAFLPKEWTLSKWNRAVYNRIVTAYQRLVASPRDSIIWRMFNKGILQLART